MTESVWYHAGYDEIWVLASRYQIERGFQAIVKVTECGFEVRDYLGLYLWKIDSKKWKAHIKKGWLIKLGHLEKGDE